MFNVWLCTLDEVRRHRKMTSTEVDDDALLTDLIQNASAELCAALRRTPMVYFAEQRFDYSKQYVKSSRLLTVDEDLLAVESVENGNGAAINTANVLLKPSNLYPRYGVILTQDAWTSGTVKEQCIGVEGWWGYVPHYPNCWRTIATLPASNLDDASDTTFDITEGSGALFEIGQYLLIDDEIMQVTARTLSVEVSEELTVDRITVERGVLGTTAAAHATAAPMKKFVQLPDIRDAAVNMTVYKYLTKDRVGGRVTVFDNNAVATEDLDRSVYQTRDRHKRHDLLFV